MRQHRDRQVLVAAIILEITPAIRGRNGSKCRRGEALVVCGRHSARLQTTSLPVSIAWDPAGDGQTGHPRRFMACFSTIRCWLLHSRRDCPTVAAPCSCSLSAAQPPLAACCPAGRPRLRIGFDSPANLNGSSIFQGALNALPNMSYLPNQQRFDSSCSSSLFANQNYLTAGFPLPFFLSPFRWKRLRLWLRKPGEFDDRT